MQTTYLVFISSTSDLAAERNAVAEALPQGLFSAYLYEKDAASDASPRDRLKKRLEDTDVFLVILGARYGSVYPRCEGDPSIVKWEFTTAGELGRYRICFQKADLDEQTIDPRQREFLSETRDLIQGKWFKFFRSPAELTTHVKDALLVWQQQVNERIQGRMSTMIEAWRKTLRAIAFAASGVAVASACATAFFDAPSGEATVLVLLLSGAVIAGCFLLDRQQIGEDHGQRAQPAPSARQS